jgi:hypothetical protein
MRSKFSLLFTPLPPETTILAVVNYGNSKGTIRNLAASTTYYYKVFIQGTSDEKAISKEMSFVTE